MKILNGHKYLYILSSLIIQIITETMADNSIKELINSKDFPVLKNDRILRVIRGELPDKLPVWIMRQAGRYLPEFQKFRKEHQFFEICTTPELACEVTLMPIRRYELDAAIIFSDILVVPQALGMEVKMEPGLGPVLPHPLTLDKIHELKKEGAVDRLKYVGQAITLTRHKLEGKVPLFGFSGAPWTLMGYMVEGGGSKTMSKAKKWLYGHPQEAHSLLGLLTDVIIDYLVMQVESGAQILQLFDSNAEYLNNNLYREFGLPYLKTIREQVRLKLKQKKLDDIPVVLFAKGAGFSLPEQAELGYEILGIDWTVDPQKAREAVSKNPNIVLQGNLDPCALYAPKESLQTYAKQMIKAFGTKNYIVNLGHGIYPDVNPESVGVFINAVHSYEV